MSREFYKSKYKVVEDLPGIGPVSAQKLAASGYKTVENIATAHQDELVATGIGEDLADKIIRAARQSMEIRFVTGEDLAKMYEAKARITTGCKTLDTLLAGGIETESITEFHGEFGSGKSQICQQLAVAVQLPEERGGLGAPCLYIDTEHVFRPARIRAVAEWLELDPTKALQNIIYAAAYTSQHQMILLDSADEVIKEHGCRMIIIDSLTSHFRSEYIGREVLAPRQQQLNKHLHKLIRLCMGFNAAAVVTNQVSANPVAYASFEPKAIGGHVLGHAAHTRVSLRKGRHNLRIAKIIASPFLPEGEAPFRITARGIEGDEAEAEQEQGG